MTNQNAVVRLRKNASLKAVAEAIRKDTEMARFRWSEARRLNPEDANRVGGFADRLADVWHNLSMIEKHMSRIANLEAS